MIDKKIILNNIPDKSENKNTTSLKFKEDLIDFLGDRFMEKTILEIGTYIGHTTRLLSFLFKKVITVDKNHDFLCDARELNIDRNNIEFMEGDIYDFMVFDEFRDKVDVIFIDAIHEYRCVLSDTINSIAEFAGSKDIYLIYDDYGLIPEVKKAVDDCLTVGFIEFVGHIGHEKGIDIKLDNREDNKNRILLDREGIICRYRSKK